MAAPDFYFGINVTFRHIHQRFGQEALYTYWRTLAREYFADLIERFTQGGLEDVEQYWREFFAAEPGADFSVNRQGSEVVIDVRQCPAIKHLKTNKREIMPLYCRHCDVINKELAQGSHLHFHMTGGDGTCRQVFSKKEG